MQFIGYCFFRIFVLIFRWLPFSALYKLSDGMCFLFYHIIKYRYKVIYNNLNNSFPNKTKSELQSLVKEAYRHIADILLETIKGLSLSEAEMRKRFKFVNPEIANALFKEHKNILLVGSHFANWEWLVTSFSLYLNHNIVGVYKPLANRYIESYTAKCRTRYGMELCPIENTRQRMVQNQVKPDAFIMLTDQSPSNTARAHWFEFLNQDTPWLHGTDYYARKYNYPICFVDNQCIQRGFYEVTLSILNDNPKELLDGEVSKIVAQKLEAIIITNPTQWLWSHKRWKHKRKIAAKK